MMFKSLVPSLKKAGMAPGALVHVGERKRDRVRLTMIAYDGDTVNEWQPDTVAACFPLRGRPGVTWLNIDGIHEVAVVDAIGQELGIHPLAIEDILNTNQRPKVDEYESLVYLVFKMVCWDEAVDEMCSEQVSLVLGDGILVSFQEGGHDLFEPVRRRIREKGRFARKGADYLAYALLDAIVDNYFVVLEQLGERMALLEEDVISLPAGATPKAIYRLKRELLMLLKLVWPLREVVGGIQRGESPLFAESTVIYLRDVYDHVIQVIELLDTFRDMASGLLDIYLSSVSNRMNEVMKVLTIIATIFIPLTFIAGLYGMNFAYMPELAWRWGYFAVLGLMVVVALVMVVYFRRKGWL